MTARISPKLRRTLVWMALLLSLAVLIRQLILFYPEMQQPVSDFTEYWVAGRLLLTGGNPYDAVQMGAVERALGRPNVNPLLMYNPPWTLSVLLPFAALPYGLGRLLWTMFQAAVLIFSADRLWSVFGGAAKLRWAAWCVSLIFVPALFALNEGQLMPLVLLGLVGFLEFAAHERWGWAGAALALASFKPQPLYLLGLALLFGMLRSRRWAVVWGGLSGLAALSALPLLFRPSIGWEYLQFLLHEPPSRWAPPTLGTLLRLWWGYEHFWLQFAPVVVGVAWLVWVWWAERQSWDWNRQLPRLLLASATFNAYGWIHDQTVLLVAVMAGAAPLVMAAPRRWAIRALGAYVLLNGILVVLQLARIGELGYVWLAPVWWGGYTILQRRLRTLPQRDCEGVNGTTE